MLQKIKQDISIGNNLKRLRKQANLTQEQVVAQLQLHYGLSITRSIYSKMELGTYNIRVSELIALKELFHTTLDEMFKDIIVPKTF